MNNIGQLNYPSPVSPWSLQSSGNPAGTLLAGAGGGQGGGLNLDTLAVQIILVVADVVLVAAVAIEFQHLGG